MCFLRFSIPVYSSTLSPFSRCMHTVLYTHQDTSVFACLTPICSHQRLFMTAVLPAHPSLMNMLRTPSSTIHRSTSYHIAQNLASQPPACGFKMTSKDLVPTATFHSGQRTLEAFSLDRSIAPNGHPADLTPSHSDIAMSYMSVAAFS